MSKLTSDDIKKQIYKLFNDVEYMQKVGIFKILKNRIVLEITLDSGITGYTIYDSVYPKYFFQSDLDLYDTDEEMQRILKEICYIIEQYDENKISFEIRNQRTWYGNRVNAHYISLKIPSGKKISYKLPSVNILDFEF